MPYYWLLCMAAVSSCLVMAHQLFPFCSVAKALIDAATHMILFYLFFYSSPKAMFILEREKGEREKH